MSGGGDPAKSMALLWRRRDGVAAAGRSGINVDRIVAAAIEVADAEGLGSLSMRRVAEKLGVGTMSLYTYVPGKAELLDVMLDTVAGETARPESVEGGWRPWLELIARENRNLILRHPWVAQASTSRPPLGPGMVAKYDYELRAVDEIGLTESEMDAVLTLVLEYVGGSAASAAEMIETERATGLSVDDWWWSVSPLLERAIEPGRYPLADRVGSAAGGNAYDRDFTFEFGLQRVLDGIAAFIETDPDERARSMPPVYQAGPPPTTGADSEG
jgi:AcrR family transcriptional regulator